MARGDLTDEQWEPLEPHLPPRKPKRGRPNADHRRIINGMLWIDRTGSPWRDLPEKYGPWRTVASRFYRWQKGGVWDRVLKALQSQKDAEEKRGARLLSGWFLYQDTPESGRVWQAYGLLSERGSKKRDGRLLAPHGQWRDQAGWSRASEATSWAYMR